MRFSSTLLLLLFVFTGYSQVTNMGKPYSWKLNNIEELMPIKMPAFDLKALKDEDAANANDKTKPWRFGHQFIVDHNLSNSGTWSTLENGDRIWRIRYKSDGAKTLNFLFSDFYMPEGGKVYLYNNDRSDLLGAYDAQQNNEQRVLGTWLVQGDDIWIEYFEPAAKAGEGKLEIFKVVHGYRTVTDMNKDVDDSLNGSGNCNYDVDCLMAGIQDMKEINKKAVAIMITGGSGFCTGALVNNTNNDGTPYFLTANHCYDNNAAQWAFRFNWISPNPVCAANTNSTNNAPNYYQTASGAILRAKREQSDFCLVEITANLPATWDLVYAGWNRSTTPASSTFGIHHPAGDIMKACRDLDAPVLSNANGSNVWVVQDWDLGVTEGGSSGSPLFDSNGRIIGQLFGGAAACNGTSDNNLFDEYGRFDVSWNAGNSSSSRLSDWLDPTNSNVMTLNYYPDQVAYALNAKASITVEQEVCDISVSPIVTLLNKGTETLTSAQINYTLNDTPSVFEWTGSLAQNEGVDISLPVMDGVPGVNTLTVNVTLPNGGTDEFPADNTATSEFIVRQFEVSNVALQINTDAFGEEVSWNLKDEDNVILYTGGNYNDFATINQLLFLTDEGCYTFTIFDSAGDGICCDFGAGSYSLSINNQVMHEGGGYGDTESVSFRLKNTLSVEEQALQSLLKVYPNPSSGIFTIAGHTNDISYTIHNVLGQKVKAGNMNAGTGNFDISAAANGVYILSLTDTATGSQANFKIVKE